MKDIVVFSGNAHLGSPNGSATTWVPLDHVDIRRFSNDCIQVQLLANCRQRDVYIVQPLVPPPRSTSWSCS